MASNDNYYQILEVPEDATVREISQSFRRLAKLHHPDRNPENREAAEEKFKQINQAYEVLRDPESRHSYNIEQYQSTSNHPPPSSNPFQNFTPSSNRDASYTERTFREIFTFIPGDRVRYCKHINTMYYGSAGYDKFDIATVFEVRQNKVVLNYGYCEGVYALFEELELAGPSEWVVQKKVRVNATQTRNVRQGPILKPGYRVTATDMEEDRVFICKVEFQGKSQDLSGWVSIVSSDGNVTLLERDITVGMNTVRDKLKAKRCFQCPKGHELIKFTCGGNYRCNICQTCSMNIHRCHECDYDVCHVCRADALWYGGMDENINTDHLYAHLARTNALDED